MSWAKTKVQSPKTKVQGVLTVMVPKIALFQLLSTPPFTTEAGKGPLILKWAGFSTFVLVFVSRDIELGVVPAVSPSTTKVFPISMKFGM